MEYDSNIIINEMDVNNMDEMDNSYYILEPPSDFSDYSPTKSDTKILDTTSATPISATTTPKHHQQAAGYATQLPPASPSSSPSSPAPTSSSPRHETGVSSPMSSPLLSDSVDYRRRFHHNFHHQYQHQQQQQQYHRHRREQQPRSIGEESSQAYYSVEDTIKVSIRVDYT
ncbi:hypothetical protein PoB_007560000 [Plakobranchus ocellatus]|uniref:Uncharacterized protein n=1 Tax=Plakobranchus ocellatus TaxID=259542 RepID=A0AAV4DYF9_9GAST|nr:hypothetical protein PoB_007560000 [Plakobranchus ocellatus]